MKINELVHRINNITPYIAFALTDVKEICVYINPSTLLAQIPYCARSLHDVEFNFRYLDYSAIDSECRDAGNFYCLIDAIHDFTWTPVNQRFEKRQYTINVLGGDEESYLVRDTRGHLVFGPLNLSGDYDYQTKFSTDEIEKLKSLDDLAVDWNKAIITEVGNDED